MFNSEIQRYNMYPMLQFHRKFSSGVTVMLCISTMFFGNNLGKAFLILKISSAVPLVA